MDNLVYLKQSKVGIYNDVYEMLQLIYLPCAHIQSQVVCIIFIIFYINIQVKGFLILDRSEPLIGVLCVVHNIQLWIASTDIRWYIEQISVV